MLQLTVSCYWHAGSEIRGKEDNDAKEHAKQQRQLSQDNVAVELSGFKETDTTPLIQELADGEAPHQNQTTGIEQMKNIPEGIKYQAEPTILL